MRLDTPLRLARPPVFAISARRRLSGMGRGPWLAILAAAVACPVAVAQTEPLPADWSFEGLPADLVALTGKPAPELHLKEWIGDEVSVAESRGKVVVLDFWATWCGPCMAAIPKNVKLVEEYEDEGLVFLGVHDSNSGWDSAQQVVDEKDINYPVALDDGGKSVEAVGLGFWPTYIVIDREGLVRGVGLMPDRVEEAVKLLLAEPVPADLAEAGAQTGGGLASMYFFAGDARPASLRAVEGKPLPQIQAEAWAESWAESWGGEAVDAARLKGRVTVLHFMSSGNGIAMRQAQALAELERKIGPQGVVVIGICPPGDDLQALAKLAGEGKAPSRLCRDAALKPEADAGVEGEAAAAAATTRPPPGIGATAAAYGVRYAPATIVIDRAGIVRGAGVRPDKVEQIAGMLLAEPVPAGPAEPAADRPRAGSR